MMTREQLIAAFGEGGPARAQFKDLIIGSDNSWVDNVSDDIVRHLTIEKLHCTITTALYELQGQLTKLNIAWSESEYRYEVSVYNKATGAWKVEVDFDLTTALQSALAKELS